MPNCHLLTDGRQVLYFNDPKAILPSLADEGQDLSPFLRGNFALALRRITSYNVCYTKLLRNITEFGIFIGIEDGIDGLIHVSDISWTKKVRHPGEMYKVGDVVRAKVLTVDKQSEKFTLGIKQLSDDPWHDVPARYPVGALVKGLVTNITDFGLFVEVEEGIEGLVHVSEISRKKVKTPAELV